MDMKLVNALALLIAVSAFRTEGMNNPLFTRSADGQYAILRPQATPPTPKSPAATNSETQSLKGVESEEEQQHENSANDVNDTTRSNEQNLEEEQQNFENHQEQPREEEEDEEIISEDLEDLLEVTERDVNIEEEQEVELSSEDDKSNSENVQNVLAYRPNLEIESTQQELPNIQTARPNLEVVLTQSELFDIPSNLDNKNDKNIQTDPLNLVIGNGLELSIDSSNPGNKNDQNDQNVQTARLNLMIVNNLGEFSINPSNPISRNVQIVWRASLNPAFNFTQLDNRSVLNFVQLLNQQVNLSNLIDENVHNDQVENPGSNLVQLLSQPVDQNNVVDENAQNIQMDPLNPAGVNVAQQNNQVNWVFPVIHFGLNILTASLPDGNLKGALACLLNVGPALFSIFKTN